MKVEKKVIANLNKCYSIAQMEREGEKQFLVAAEKQDPCYLFSEAGEKLEEVWDGPGGVMTMVQVPGEADKFLATRRFYSPNDSKEAEIIIVEKEGGQWKQYTLCKTPFVHRFGILNRAGVNYILVCCLKSGHEYKNDWRFAGACYGGVLPTDLDQFKGEKTLELELLKDNMLRNHGYSKLNIGGYEAGVVGCEQGTFLFEPPAVLGAKWTITCIHDLPSSDSVLIDFDGDGELELGCIAPFHGNSLTIYHKDEYGNYVPQWKYAAKEADTEMIHGTWADEICGVNSWVVGWRKGTKDTIIITWDEAEQNYKTEFLDRNTGCANAMHFVNKNGEDIIVAANREIDEIAYYKVTK